MLGVHTIAFSFRAGIDSFYYFWGKGYINRNYTFAKLLLGSINVAPKSIHAFWGSVLFQLRNHATPTVSRYRKETYHYKFGGHAYSSAERSQKGLAGLQQAS